MFLLKLRIFGKSLSFGLLMLVFFLSTGLFSQSKDNYELLWEIQHKNSDQKSYLFGTMHMADKRLFNFSDAMLPAIMNSDAFALELHPNVILESLLDDFQKTDKNENIFRKVLSEEDYRRLDERFKNINGISIDDYPNLHYYLIETMIFPETVKEDDMITIVDSYLYGLASMFDKQIYGLEEIENQLPNLDDVNEIDEEEIRETLVKMLEISDEEYLKMMEEMIEIYAEGNITRLFNYMADDTLDNKLMFRNRVMVNSMKDIMDQKTLFAAVGAAHLPGENGIIKMLQNDGYEVNRVVSPFTGVSNQIELVPNTKKWHRERNNELGFSVLTPSKPFSYTVDQNFEIFTTIDLVTNDYFMYFVFELNNELDDDPDTLLDNFITSYFDLEDKEIIEIKKDGHPDGFRTIYYKEGDNYKRIFAGITNGHLYSFFNENKRKSSLNSAFSEAFFNSIEFFPPVKRETSWEEYYDNFGAYSIHFPENQVEKFDTEIAHPFEADGEPLKIHLFGSVDNDTKTRYILRYVNQPLGYFLENENAAIDEFKVYYNGVGRLQNEPRKIEVNGLPFHELEGFLSNESHFVSRVFFRGNRQYMLLAIKETPGERVNKNNPFFNSFYLNEYKSANLSRTINIDKRYTVSFPEKMKVVKDEDSYYGTSFINSTKYFGANLNSGSTFVFEKVRLKPYFRIKDLEEYYTTFEEHLKSEGDTLLDSRITTLNGMKAKRLVYKNQKSNVHQHLLVVLDNDYLFTLQAYISDEEQEVASVEAFYNSFTKRSKRNHFDYTASKASQILKDLTSKNRNTQANAQEAFLYYVFDEDDIPALQHFLARTYPDDDDYEGIKSKVIKEFAYINHPEAARVLNALYNNPNTTGVHKIAILEALPQIEAENALQFYTQLLFENPPQYTSDSPMVIFDGLHLNDINVVDYLEPLSKFIDVPNYRNELMYLVNKSIVADSLAFDLVHKQSALWLKHFNSDVVTCLAAIDNNDSHFFGLPMLYNYIEIIDTLRISTPEIEKSLNQIASKLDSMEWLKTKTVIAMLNLNLDPDARVLQELLESKYSRFEVMEALVNNDKKAYIPEKHLDAVAYSKLSLYNFIGLYTNFPENISHLGEFKENNKTYHAFSFEVDEEPGVSYLAVVEAVQIKFEDFRQFNVFFGGNKADGNWHSTANSLVLEYSYFSE